jgi:phosphopantothenoylcysteine decarboxylase / phosphopantothenate---cysteine ligase
MNALNSKHILLGVTGGIAAYKSADLVRRLREAGAEVEVVMTDGAQAFITPLTLQAVSGNVVRTTLFDPNAEAAMGHIELARWADVVIVAPASADFMAKLSYGHADDLLSTLCLASTAPLVLAPAMNQQMWINSVTQENVRRLLKRGVKLLGPADGSQACGEIGPGRMVEPLEIINFLDNIFVPKILSGKSVVITAGPTQEMIDPVRYITNKSSGKMGYALAEAAAAAGANVTLISGPVHLTAPHNVRCINVNTAQEMLNAVQKEIKHCNIFIAAAAVADYRCVDIAQQKIKKEKNNLVLQLERNPDILATVAKLAKKPFCVGFAAETENVIAYAKKKFKEKNLDLIIANQVGEDKGFDSNQNQVTVISAKSEKTFPLMSKKYLAAALIKLITENLIIT